MEKSNRKVQAWRSFGDVNMLDYGGGFFREVSPRVFQFVELTNMDEACGRDNEGRSRYDVQLSLVDLNAIPPEELEFARKSCGWDGMPDHPAALAEVAYQYGLRAPLGSWDGNNAGKLLRAAKSEARALLDAGRLAEQLQRPVNKLGSTAAEYMRGDINAALARGMAAQDPAAILVGKIQSATVTTMRQSDIRKCKFAILVPEHYRPDGTCKCGDKEHRAMMISEWEYAPEDFSDVPLDTNSGTC